MKNLFILITSIFFIGCSGYTAMSGEEISKAIAECADNNLSYVTVSNLLIDGGGSITKIFCRPKGR